MSYTLTTEQIATALKEVTEDGALALDTSIDCARLIAQIERHLTLTAEEREEYRRVSGFYEHIKEALDSEYEQDTREQFAHIIKANGLN